MNIVSDFLAINLKSNPNKTALIEGHGPNTKKISYKKLAEKINSYAYFFNQNGLTAQGKALMLVPVSIELYAILLGLIKIGAVPVFIEPGYGLGYINQALKNIELKAIVGNFKTMLFSYLIKSKSKKTIRYCLQSFPGAIKLAPKNFNGEFRIYLASNHPAILTFSSGIESAPKPIVKSHKFLHQQHIEINKATYNSQLHTDYISLPIFLLSNLASGVTSIIPVSGKISDCIKQIVQFKPSRLSLSPRLLENITNQSPNGLKFVNEVLTGGAIVHPTLMKRVQEKFTNAKIKVVYGSSEAEPVALLPYKDITKNDLARMKGGDGLLVGTPSAGIHLRFAKDGKLQLKGKQVNSAGWFNISDYGYLDNKKRLWLKGRKPESIVQNGQRIFSLQVTVALKFLPEINQSALIEKNGKVYLCLSLHNNIREKDIISQLKAIQIDKILYFKELPTEKRHHSKIDYNRLKTLI